MNDRRVDLRDIMMVLFKEVFSSVVRRWF
jgi:hypothetical protein